MEKQDKFVTKWITWIVEPDGCAYMSSCIDDNKDECESRHGKMMKDPYWNGYKFIHVPISVPIPDDVAHKTIME